MNNLILIYHMNMNKLFKSEYYILSKFLICWNPTFPPWNLFDKLTKWNDSNDSCNKFINFIEKKQHYR